MSKVLLINWDNYPNSTSGGVYAWAKLLIESLDDHEYVVLNILSNPNVNSKYKLPKNVSGIIELPLYGCLRPEEYYGDSGHSHQELKSVALRSRKTSDKVINSEFRPIFEQLVNELISTKIDTLLVADLLVELNSFFRTRDMKTCVESAITFNAFTEILGKDAIYSSIKVDEVLEIYSFLQRVLTVISIELPKVDLIHASNAWFPALVGICLRRRDGTPMIVTEHGVAFKDLLLYDRLSDRSQSYRILWQAILGNIIKTVYDGSDLISQVCEANVGTTKMLGTETKTMVCYNGINTDKYRPVEVPADAAEVDRPTVIFVGRIELLKDVLSLIQAVAFVKIEISNVLCKIYGTSTDLTYARECLELVADLDLEDNIRFMGNTSSPELAYNSGDVVVLSSIREGFPYTVIEAMACGKTVVATDVGGVSEALSGCGLLIKSRNPFQVSRAILRVLTDHNLRSELGMRAAQRVEQKFTLEKSVSTWRETYAEMLDLSRGATVRVESRS